MNDNLHSRRLFLQRGLTMVAASATVPLFLDNTVFAMADPLDSKRTQQDSGKDGKILVVVQLSGGNDGLSTVIPYADDAYHRARPSIGKQANEVLKINNYIGLHPNLAPLKELYDAGMMTIAQGVGYPNPNRSHFRSMDIWHTAEPDKETVTTGWLGRYFDNTCDGADPHCGICIGDRAPLAMQGDIIQPLSLEKPENYRYQGSDRENYEKLNTAKKADAVDVKKTAKPGNATKGPQIITPGSQLEFLTRTAMDAQLSSDNILKMTSTYQSRNTYPNGEFGLGLKSIAAMIRGGLPTRVYYVSLGGFDTHANQQGRHDRLMQDYAQGVSAFWKDMKEQKNDDRVMMMAFSEFGRRVEQNASGGTDHGAAAPMYLYGNHLKTGLIGRHPSLTQLDQGDLTYTLDFRSVYATILEKWMNTKSAPILGKQYEMLSILKA